MKKNRKFRIGICVLLLLALLSAAVLPIAAEAGVGAGTVNVTYRSAPVCARESRIIGSSTYVPLRAFCAEFGLTDLLWDASARSATLTADGLSLWAAEGEQWIEVNGRCFWAPDGVRIVGGTMMVPIRPLARALGLSVTWESETASVMLEDTGEGYAAPAEQVYDDEDLYWLSRIISAESRGEPLRGQLAVGNVVLNRAASPTFPDTVKGVIFDTRYAIQFSPVANGTIYADPAELSVVAAKLALEGYTLSSEIIYFLNAELATNFWVPQNRPYAMTVGCHDFYT